MCKKLTEAQANDVLAELIDTSDKTWWWHAEWNPATKPEHALECLIAYNESVDDLIGIRLADVGELMDLNGWDFCTATCNYILQAIGAGQIGEVE